MTVKTFADLVGLKEGNIDELKTIGIDSVDELKTALSDDAKVKDIIKTLSGVGPKTVENWKVAFSEAAPVSESKKKMSKKKVAESEAEAEIVEPETVESGVYMVKAKPELSEEATDALAKRAMISGRRPAFKRQEWFRYSKLGEKWRKPKGLHSKMKRCIKRRPPMVDIGYRGPVFARNLHPSGFEEVLVYNVEGLEDINPKVQAVRVGGTVGTKKRIAIEDRAAELGIRVLNRMV